MKKDLRVSALVDQPELMEEMVEKLAGRDPDARHGRTVRTGSWQTVETSSVEKYVTGMLKLDFENESIRIPFISSFIFSCTGDEAHPYKLNWSMALS